MKSTHQSVSDPVRSEAHASTSNEILGSAVFAFSDLEPFNMRGLAIPSIKFPHKKKEMSFPFLELPLELREKVYAFTLCDYEEIEARLRDPDPHPSPQPVKTLILRHHKKAGKTRTQEAVYPSRFTALLRVNRIIYREALPIFYSGNTFGFSDPRDFFIFTCSLARHRRDLIKRIRLPPGYDVIGDRTVWDTTQAMKALESVSVVAPKRFWDTWGVGNPASESLYRALRDGVMLSVRTVTYSTGFADEIVVQEWVCRKGVAGWKKKIEDEGMAG